MNSISMWGAELRQSINKFKYHNKEAFESEEIIAKFEHEEQTPMLPGRKIRQSKDCVDLVGRQIQFSLLDE